MALMDQIATVERALGERMIEHALVIARAWMNELGENNPYEQAYEDIRSRYNALFADWLTSDDPSMDEILDNLTGNTYRLIDELYTALRLKRGMSPEMHGFNKDNPQSVMHYLSNCLRLTEEDFQWMHDIYNDPQRATIALMAVAALAKNIRECFNEQAMMVLIEGINGANEVVAEQCLANILILLAHYDVRIDFFPDLQNAFIAAVEGMDDDGEQAFHTLCALVRSTKMNWREPAEEGELKIEDLPQELQQLLELTGNQNSLQGVMSWLPASEQEYMQGIVEMLPDTWVYSTLMADSQERAGHMAIIYLSVGRMDLLWDRTEVAMQWLLQQLRKGSTSPLDYINYGHCLMLQGDKIMAFENYRQARQMCKSAKEFYALFRPNRRHLVDRGIPVEQVYLIEDQLLTL